MEHQLPELYQADLDREAVAALFADLEVGAEIDHVQVKATTGPPPHDRPASLQEAHQLLSQGAAKAVQVRYRFEQQSWCDTLMVMADAVRLVRTKVDTQLGDP